ncbi:MAG: S9 family peptidase [Pseudomonadota bacterium]
MPLASAPAPTTHKEPATFTAHGIERTDEYHWLRAENWQEVMRKPETLPAPIKAQLDAENAYTDAVMAPLSELRDTLFEEMKGRIKKDDSSVPTPDGPWAYFSRFVAGGEYRQICRQPRDGGEVTILLDGNALAKELDYFQFGSASHSPDHRQIAYSVDDNGSEYYSVRIKDLASGELLADQVENTTGGVTWARDGKSFFYTKVDDNHRPYAVAQHVLGTDTGSDREVYRESDPAFFVSVGETSSRAFLVIEANDHQTSETRIIPMDALDSDPVLIAPRSGTHEYDLEHVGEYFYILTNTDGAEDKKIVRAPVDAPHMDNWQDVLAHEPGRYIVSFGAVAGALIRLERNDALPRIVIRDLTTDGEHAIAFDEEAYSLGLQGGYEFDTTSLRFSYSSMTTPGQVFDYDIVSRERTLRKTQEIPSGHDPAHYVTLRIIAPGHDGAQIPVTILHHKDTAIDGSAPALLYGYGSYGITMPAGFSTTRLSLVDRGFVYAIAHIRGGKERGQKWYETGKRAQKTNTFKDFISAGEALIDNGYTARGRIVAEGGSAGGLLMGAVVNMAPDLFAGVVAFVPFVDVLNTILDDTLPLTPPEWTEWGNPITSKEAYDTIASYSPYDQISAQAYPPILAIAGLTDPRVTYWEPAKWVARLRAHMTNNAPILMKMNMAAGHGGASGRFEGLRDAALATAFALAVTDKAASAQA